MAFEALETRRKIREKDGRRALEKDKCQIADDARGEEARQEAEAWRGAIMAEIKSLFETKEALRVVEGSEARCRSRRGKGCVHRGWHGMKLDIKTAFLNARPDSEDEGGLQVLLKPRAMTRRWTY